MIKLNLPLKPPLEPMEAEHVHELPEGDGWQFEPKFDGFRCIVFRDQDQIVLQSKTGTVLNRYFPEVIAQLQELAPKRFVLDGELVVPVERRLSFDQLQLRLHPAASRVRKLAAESPASYIAFDLLLTERGTELLDKPLRERRERLEQFAHRYFGNSPQVFLSPATQERRVAERWLEDPGGGLDGVMAKQLDAPYLPGERSAMQKVKPFRTADCVVAGFRYAAKRRKVGSLLLGLFDDDGLLHHVGFAANLGKERDELTARLERLRDGASRGPHGFTGRSPGGPSRWNPDRTGQYESLPHQLVVEVRYDQVTNGRFRHGTKLLRWRSDKRPRQCTFEQLLVAGDAGWLLPAR